MSRPRRLAWRAAGRRGRAGRERGASIVEFAVLFPLLVVLALGTVDTAFVINDTIRLRSAVREGARLISTVNFATELASPPSSTTSCGATGSNTTSIWAACRTLSMLTDSGLPASTTKVRVRMVETNGSGGFDTVASGGFYTNATNGAVMVCVLTTTSSRTGMLKAIYDRKTLQQKIVMPLQNPSLITVANRIEGDYGSGGTWTFCDPNVSES